MVITCGAEVEERRGWPERAMATSPQRDRNFSGLRPPEWRAARPHATSAKPCSIVQIPTKTFLESYTIGSPEFLSLAVGFFVHFHNFGPRTLLGRSGGRFASNGAANVSSCPPSPIPVARGKVQEQRSRDNQPSPNARVCIGNEQSYCSSQILEKPVSVVEIYVYLEEIPGNPPLLE